jgi:hypothetical protein
MHERERETKNVFIHVVESEMVFVGMQSHYSVIRKQNVCLQTKYKFKD